MVSNFKTNLPSNYVAQIESFPWKTVFKFGDGRNVKSKEIIIFPVVTADKNCKIKVEILKENIQLSLSKSSLKKTQTVIDLDRDKATFSPWSNGNCERHNHLITTMLLKMRDDVKCSYDTALAWAITAKINW